MRRPLPTLFQRARTKGAAFVEYVSLLGLIGVVVIFSVLQFGAEIDETFGGISTTVATEIEEATDIPVDGGGPTPGGPTGPGGDPLAPNVPGLAPPVGPVVGLDFTVSFQTGGFLQIGCVQSAADVMGNDVWCIGQDLADRPSNLEWQTNAAQGADIWHGQLCLYDTDAGAFVTNLHYVYDEDNMASVPGLADYDGTWLVCQSHNEPSGGLIMDNGVAAWDNSESFWVPGPVGTRGTLPAEIPFTAPPTWSDDFGTLATECVYSNDMQRWLTYDMRVSGGLLTGNVPCQ